MFIPTRSRVLPLAVSLLLLPLFWATPVRADETQGEDDRYRWTHSEQTTTDYVLEDGTEVRIHSITKINDKRWLKKEADVGPPGEVLIFNQDQTRTHTERWDGSIEDYSYTYLTRKSEFSLQLPDDSFSTWKKVKSTPTGPDTGTSEQSAFSQAIMYSVNPDDAQNPNSWGGRAEQTLALKYIGDFMRPVGDESIDCSSSVGNPAAGFAGWTYRRRTTWADDGSVARMAVSMDGPNAPVPGAVYEYVPAEGWRANGVLIPPNRLDETFQIIRGAEGSALGIFPDDAPPQEFVPDYLDQALGLGPMA